MFLFHTTALWLVRWYKHEEASWYKGPSMVCFPIRSGPRRPWLTRTTTGGTSNQQLCWNPGSRSRRELKGASLVAQWLRVRLPMQGTRVRALVWGDPTCRGATGPVSHNCWACASGACAPQRERLRWWGARASRWRVAPALRWRVAPTCRSWRKPSHRSKDPTQPKINK